MRAGEKVRIRYQKVDGVLVANRIAEKALRCEGTVRSVDKHAGTVTIEEGPLYKAFHGPGTFQLAKDCKITLCNGHEGALADLQPGDRVSRVYELPNGSRVADRIRERTTT